MHTKQQIIFENIGGLNQEEIQGLSDDPIYLYNTLIFEISNNWLWVRQMMDKYRNNELKEVDMMERDWFSFLLENHIDLGKYGKDSDQFVEDWFKNKE